MIKAKRLIALLLLLCMLPLALFACNSQSNEPTESESESAKPTEKPTATEEVIIGTPIDLLGNEDKIKIIGRYQATVTGIALDHTASGIEFSGVMKGKVYVDIRCHAQTYFTVFVDGKRQSDRYEVKAGRKATSLCVADLGEIESEHTVRVLKQTESQYSLAEFRRITLDGELTSPPAEKDFYLEFIGDSLTCAMGNLANSSVASASGARYEDGTQGYAFLTAEKLNADYSIISQSGIGVADSWGDDIVDYYTKLTYSRDKDTPYDFGRVPDMVVINLGTNDYHLNNKFPERDIAARMKDETKAFIELVRESYGEDMPIIWAYDLVGSCMYDTVKQAIDELGGESAGIYTCKLTTNTSGGDGHPNRAGHIKAAEELTNFILSIVE